MVSLKNEEDGYGAVSEVQEIASNEGNNEDRNNFYEDVKDINEETKFQAVKTPCYVIWLENEGRKTSNAITSPYLKDIYIFTANEKYEKTPNVYC